MKTYHLTIYSFGEIQIEQLLALRVPLFPDSRMESYKMGSVEGLPKLNKKYEIVFRSKKSLEQLVYGEGDVGPPITSYCIAETAKALAVVSGGYIILKSMLGQYQIAFGEVVGNVEAEKIVDKIVGYRKKFKIVQNEKVLLEDYYYPCDTLFNVLSSLGKRVDLKSSILILHPNIRIPIAEIYKEGGT